LSSGALPFSLALAETETAADARAIPLLPNIEQWTSVIKERFQKHICGIAVPRCTKFRNFFTAHRRGSRATNLLAVPLRAITAHRHKYCKACREPVICLPVILYSRTWLVNRLTCSKFLFLFFFITPSVIAQTFQVVCIEESDIVDTLALVLKKKEAL
jgi:hypothetical protein